MYKIENKNPLDMRAIELSSMRLIIDETYPTRNGKIYKDKRKWRI